MVKQKQEHKTRKQLQKENNEKIQKIWNKHHLQPSITLEYLYMRQTNKKEATEMLTQEIQRTLLYWHTLSYNNYTDTVEQTLNQIIQTLNQ